MITESNDISSDQQHFIAFLALVYGRVLKPFEELFGHELTNLQLITLCALCRSGPTPVTELAHRLHTPKQQMTKVLSRLADAGYIRRYPHCDDKRVVLVGLTDETDALLSEKHRQFCDMLEDIIARHSGKTGVQSFFDDIGEVERILAEIPVNINE